MHLRTVPRRSSNLKMEKSQVSIEGDNDFRANERKNVPKEFYYRYDWSNRPIIATEIGSPRSFLSDKNFSPIFLSLNYL